jgi:3-dehydro-L-gulonate 2-dehydrogenase
MRLVSNIKEGIVLPNVKAEKVNGLGGLEIWDGQSGLGVTNALICAKRAIELAKEHGIGCIGLRNTNHWMRAGTYAKMAADMTAQIEEIAAQGGEL